MKKLLVAVIVIALLATGSGVALAGGPAEKATGTVGGPIRGWYADFNAHESMGNRPAKGDMYMWSDEVGRELYLDVKYVEIDGDEGWFSALCTYDSFGTVGGKWLFVKVYDGGTPGRKGDYIGWDWNSDTNEANAAGRVSTMADPANWWAVTDGNLVVHTYD
jgi:hypothetical protein